jgi:hypothetical protein
MSHHAHNRVRIGTARLLGARPQECFFLTTDEHRWTQIFRGVASDIRFGVVETHEDIAGFPLFSIQHSAFSISCCVAIFLECNWKGGQFSWQ